MLIQKSILRDAYNDLALHFLAKLDIMVVTDIDRNDIDFIARTLNLLPVAHVDHFAPEKLGKWLGRILCSACMIHIRHPYIYTYLYINIIYSSMVIIQIRIYLYTSNIHTPLYTHLYTRHRCPGRGGDDRRQHLSRGQGDRNR